MLPLNCVYLAIRNNRLSGISGYSSGHFGYVAGACYVLRRTDNRYFFRKKKKNTKKRWNVW